VDYCCCYCGGGVVAAPVAEAYLVVYKL